MIEMPEALTIAHQMDETLTGKTISHFARGALVHKFLWLSKPAEEYDTFLAGKPVTGAKSYGRSIYLYVGDTHLLWFGELGGRILYHSAGQPLPAKVPPALGLLRCLRHDLQHADVGFRGFA